MELAAGMSSRLGMDAAADDLQQMRLADDGLPPDDQDCGEPDACRAACDDDDDNFISSPPSAGDSNSLQSIMRFGLNYQQSAKLITKKSHSAGHMMSRMSLWQ